MNAPTGLTGRATPDSVTDAGREIADELAEVSKSITGAFDEVADRIEGLENELKEAAEDWIRPLQRDLGRLVDGVLDHLERGLVDADELLGMARRLDREYPEYAPPEGVTI